MFELRIKTIRRWKLIIDGEIVYIRTKKGAIKYGTILINSNKVVNLIEENEIWDCSKKRPVMLETQEFNRNTLLKTN